VQYQRYKETIIARVDTQTRTAIESIASERRVSMAEVARDLIAAGMEARGLIG